MCPSECLNQGCFRRLLFGECYGRKVNASRAKATIQSSQKRLRQSREGLLFFGAVDIRNSHSLVNVKGVVLETGSVVWFPCGFSIVGKRSSKSTPKVLLSNLARAESSDQDAATLIPIVPLCVLIKHIVCFVSTAGWLGVEGSNDESRGFSRHV